MSRSQTRNIADCNPQTPAVSRKPRRMKKPANDRTAKAAEQSLPKQIRDVFLALDRSNDGALSSQVIIAALEAQGILPDDPRLSGVIEALQSAKTLIDAEAFSTIFASNFALIEHAVKERFIIPRFAEFRREVGDIFETCSADKDGDVADYIPQLARVDPDQFAVAVATVDGQRAGFGDFATPYCVQSTCKPITYAMALDLNGEEYVHKHVGREPSGRSFNELALNAKGQPHNPMINAGAIMCSSMIHPSLPLADRFDHVMETWTALGGGAPPRFNNSMYLSEKATADRNFALAYSMREKGVFPEGVDLLETLDFYFQTCSIDVTAQQAAVIAATLANAGVCPLTNKRVFSNDTVKNCLSLMYSCGMYDFSGEFAFTIGLPAKSGVSGAMMVVVPQVMGIAIWAPRLDSLGNSVRGVGFCRKLVERFNFHNYDSISGQEKKKDPYQAGRTVSQRSDLSAHQCGESWRCRRNRSPCRAWRRH